MHPFPSHKKPLLIAGYSAFLYKVFNEIFIEKKIADTGKDTAEVLAVKSHLRSWAWRCP